jgi:hypothetical protein
MSRVLRIASTVTFLGLMVYWLLDPKQRLWTLLIIVPVGIIAGSVRRYREAKLRPRPPIPGGNAVAALYCGLLLVAVAALFMDHDKMALGCVVAALLVVGVFLLIGPARARPRAKLWGTACFLFAIFGCVTLWQLLPLGAIAAIAGLLDEGKQVQEDLESIEDGLESLDPLLKRIVERRIAEGMPIQVAHELMRKEAESNEPVKVRRSSRRRKRKPSPPGTP